MLFCCHFFRLYSSTMLLVGSNCPMDLCFICRVHIGGPGGSFVATTGSGGRGIAGTNGGASLRRLVL